MCSTDCFLAILAFLFPPLPVWVKRGICSADSLINLALCCLGWLPGLIHAWYIINKYPDPYEVVYERLSPSSGRLPPGAAGGVVYYTSAHAPQAHHCHPPAPQQGMPHPAGSVQIPPQQQQGYNTFQAGDGERSPKRYQEFRQQVDVEAGEGSAHQGGPPSYAEVVKGDNKVQSHD